MSFPLDGYLENHAILDAMLSKTSALDHDVHLALHDLTKAFDVCCHQTIKQTTWKTGILQVIIEHTECNNETSRLIPLICGVKNREPFLPILFNWITNEAVATAEGISMEVGMWG